jgi:hypothetical protein
MRLSWLEYRLLTYYAFAFYFTACKTRVVDVPVTA